MAARDLLRPKELSIETIAPGACKTVTCVIRLLT